MAKSTALRRPVESELAADATAVLAPVPVPVRAGLLAGARPGRLVVGSTPGPGAGVEPALGGVTRGPRRARRPLRRGAPLVRAGRPGRAAADGELPLRPARLAGALPADRGGLRAGAAGARHAAGAVGGRARGDDARH